MRLSGAITLLILLLMSSCSFQREAVVAETPIEGWWSAATVALENQDTVRLRDIDILLRYHSQLLTSSSIELHIVTTTPQQEQIAELVTLPLRSRDSLSKRDVELIELPYRRRVNWREVGEYRISIYPTQPVDGVEAVGIAIE